MVSEPLTKKIGTVSRNELIIRISPSGSFATIESIKDGIRIRYYSSDGKNIGYTDIEQTNSLYEPYKELLGEAKQ